MNRRSFIVAASTTLGACGNFLASHPVNAQSGRLQLHDLHDQIAVRARELANGNSLTIRILLPNGSSANVLPVASQFRESTGIDIELTETAVDEINSRLIIETLAGGESIDLALPATFGLPDLVEAGALANLDDLAASYQPVDFQDQVLYSLGDYYNDSLYGYQTDGDAYLMFYNRSMLEDTEEQMRFADQHGYPLAVPRTWPELDAMMAFFHRPEDDQFGGALFRTVNYMAWEFWIRFHAKGYWPFNNEMEPQIAHSAGQEALEELIAASSYLCPGARTNGLFENWEAYAAGNIFCNIGWGGTQKYLNGPDSQIRNNLAFGPTPGGEIDGTLVSIPYFNWGWNYTVSSGSKIPEIAYLFALYASSPAMSTIAVRAPDGFFDPFREEHYTDAGIAEAYSAEFLDAHRESMTNSIPDLYLKGQGEYFDNLRQNLALAMDGEITAFDALDRTSKQWEQTTRRLGRSNQIAQWSFLRSRYPAELRRILR